MWYFRGNETFTTENSADSPREFWQIKSASATSGKFTVEREKCGQNSRTEFQMGYVLNVRIHITPEEPIPDDYQQYWTDYRNTHQGVTVFAYDFENPVILLLSSFVTTKMLGVASSNEKKPV